MVRDVREPQRARIADQPPEQAVPLRPMINRSDLCFVQADRNELGQPAVLADHPQRTVPCVDQCDRGLHDPAEYRLKLRTAAHRENRLQQAMHPVAGRDHGLKPALKLGQQVIQLQIRQDRMLLWGFHGGGPPPAALDNAMNRSYGSRVEKWPPGAGISFSGYLDIRRGNDS